MDDPVHVIDAIPLEERLPPANLAPIGHVVKVKYVKEQGAWVFRKRDADAGYPEVHHSLLTRRGGITQFQVTLEGETQFIYPYMRLRTQIHQPYRRLYFNLQPISETEIHFCAEYVPMPKKEQPFSHEFYFWITDDQGKLILGRDRSGPRDPDVLNPGDHPKGVLLST